MFIPKFNSISTKQTWWGIPTTYQPGVIPMGNNTAYKGANCFHSLECQAIVEERGVTEWIMVKYNIKRTESQNLNVSQLGLLLSLYKILKPSVKWRMKM